VFGKPRAGTYGLAQCLWDAALDDNLSSQVNAVAARNGLKRLARGPLNLIPGVWNFRIRALEWVLGKEDGKLAGAIASAARTSPAANAVGFNGLVGGAIGRGSQCRCR
jgi:hypothetical protein